MVPVTLLPCALWIHAGLVSLADPVVNAGLVSTADLVVYDVGLVLGWGLAPRLLTPARVGVP